MGGALNAGLNGASFGQAMMSGLIGAGIGGLGGAAFGSTGTNGFLGSWGPGVGIALLVAGGAYAVATGNLDTFVGGVTGAAGGWATGTRIATGKWPWAQANSTQVQQQKQEQKINETLKTDSKIEVSPKNHGKKLVPNYDVEGEIKSFDLVSDSDLIAPVKENYQRFLDSLPSQAEQPRMIRFGNGSVAFQAKVPASNIPGSYAVYEKQVNIYGNTTQFTKTTYAPDGTIVHVKDKITGQTIP